MPPFMPRDWRGPLSGAMALMQCDRPMETDCGEKIDGHGVSFAAHRGWIVVVVLENRHRHCRVVADDDGDDDDLGHGYRPGVVALHLYESDCCLCAIDCRRVVDGDHGSARGCHFDCDCCCRGVCGGGSGADRCPRHRSPARYGLCLRYVHVAVTPLVSVPQLVVRMRQER